MELDEKTKQQITLIDSSSAKFKGILQKEQGRKKDKFKNLGGDLLATANYFDKEIKKANAPAPKYHRYKYGSLVMVDYGLSIGDELCGNHFSIILTNDDTPYDSVVTVIPLTSKSGKNRLSLDELLPLLFTVYRGYILKGFNDYLRKQIEESTEINEKLREFFVKEIGEEKTKLLFENKDYVLDETVNLPQDLCDMISHSKESFSEYEKNYEKYQKAFERYQNKNRISYAILNQIRTISKFRILKPINEYDPLNNLLIPKEYLLKIEKEIVKKYFKKAEKLNTPKVDKK